MHKYLKAVGFSNIKKKDLEIIKNEIIESPDFVKVTKDSEGYEFVEISKKYADNIGITICGFYDEDDIFCMEYYFPFAYSDEISTNELVDIEKHAAKESYAGVCDEMRLGVTLIFYLQNVADFLSEHRHNIQVKGLRGVYLSALSVDGTILLPIQEKVFEKQSVNKRYEKRNQLIAEAREGNEEAIDNLTLHDMDIYNSLSKRIKKEDIFSIVRTTFMPYGIESDQYCVIGEIIEIEEVENKFTGEKLYVMMLESNDITFKVTINKKDLLGEPAIGRRYKGVVWMQGSVCL